MGERKRRVGDEEKGKSSVKKSKKLRRSSTYPRKDTRSKMRRDKRSPGFPTSIWKPLDDFRSKSAHGSDEAIDSDEGEMYANDIYEYEQPMAEEESKKNRRFDPVENFEYELPEQFEDENVLSDDFEENGSEDDDEIKVIKDENDDEVDNEDEKHARMLQEITGMPSQAFKGRKRNGIVVSETYPESEYNPNQDVLYGNSRISIEDLLDPLHEKQGYSKLRKRVQQIEKKSIPTQAPLSKVDQEKSERMAAYMKSKKELTMWEPIVKRNREAPTINFDHEVDLNFSTVGAIASEYKPRTEIEKKIASLVHDDRIMEAHRNDGSRLLELNDVSFEDEKERHNRIAKMRSLLFRHELKAKHIKKIKSKLYRRLLNKDSKKGASQISTDPKAAKELAMKQEFKRAEERMTLKHKNSSKWAKRILSRGLNSQDENTRAAITEQLNQHALLTRKMNSMKDGSSSSSSEESSDEDELDECKNGSAQAGDLKLIEKAKEKALKKLDEEDDTPNTGLLSLPFMVRGLKKRKDAAAEEGQHVIEEFESMSRQLEDSTAAQNKKSGKVSGRMIFGVDKTKAAPKPAVKVKVDNYYGQSDSEDDHEGDEGSDAENFDSNNVLKVSNDAMTHDEYSKIDQNSILKSFDETVRDPGPKTSYEVSMFVSNNWKKVGREMAVDVATKISAAASKPVLEKKHPKETMEVLDSGIGTDDEEPMTSPGPKDSYDLPSQAELIQQAFVGDDVEEEFKKEKEEILNLENPEPEKPVLLPGWGQWTQLQKRKGAPSWMTRQYADSKKKREEALKKRKDAQLKHVIISEKIDKKSEKLHTTALPYPFTSKEVFEQSIRMPIGPEFNPATAIGALNRPEVIKKPGVIIKPIEFVEVNSQEKGEERTSGGPKKQKRKSVKSIKMTKRPVRKVR